MKIKPWIGDAYNKQKRRILVVGESAYSTSEWRWSRWSNIELIRTQVAEDRERALREMAKAVSGKVNLREREFWNHVAFANFVSCSIGHGSISRPRHEHWVYSRRLFRAMIDELSPSPTHIVVFGSTTWRYMPPENFNNDRYLQGYRFKNGKCAIATYVNHPSSARHGHFDLGAAQRHIQNFLAKSFLDITWRWSEIEESK